jgi:hypothetical protein
MKIFLIMLAFASYSLHAQFCIPQFTEDAKIDIKENELLIVTHASTEYDFLSHGKKGINQTIKKFTDNKKPVIYLQGENPPKSYYYKNCHPTFYVLSYGGEFFFNFKSARVTTIGGHWQACQLITTRKIFKTWSDNNINQDLFLTQITDAIYTIGEINLRRDDPYYSKVHKLIQKAGTNKITLEEILEQIESTQLKISFLKRMIDFFEMPTDRNISIKLYKNPKVNYQFVDKTKKSINLIFKRSQSI